MAKKKKSKVKKTKKKVTKAKKKPAKKKTKRKPNAAFMAPLIPSTALAAVVGAKPLPRTKIVKKIWDYIKKYKLQDTTDKTMIVPDEKLAAIFKSNAKVSMFQMMKLIKANVTKV